MKIPDDDFSSDFSRLLLQQSLPMTSIVVGLIGILVAVVSGGSMYRSGRISRGGYYGVIGVMTAVFVVILALVMYNARNP